MKISTSSSSLWFERLFASLKLGFVSGVILIGSLPFALLLAFGSFAVGAAEEAINEATFAPFLLVIAVVLYYCMRYMHRNLQALRDYSLSILPSDESISLDSLYKLKGPVLVWAAVMAIFVPLFYIFSPLPLALFVVQQPAWGYFVFIQSSFIWVYGYSM